MAHSLERKCTHHVPALRTVETTLNAARGDSKRDRTRVREHETRVETSRLRVTDRVTTLRRFERIVETLTNARKITSTTTLGRETLLSDPSAGSPTESLLRLLRPP